MEEDRNCTLERVAKHEAVFAADVHFDVEVTRQASAIKVRCNGVQVKNAKMGDKALKPGALASLMSQGVKDEIDALYTRLVERMDGEIDAQDDDAWRDFSRLAVGPVRRRNSRSAPIRCAASDSMVSLPRAL